MEVLLQPESDAGNAISFWKDPVGWLKAKNLGRGYWIFFAAAFFFDAGFSIYVFIFNLYLLDLHFNERSMGLIGGAATIGSLAGTLPAGALARRFGLRPLLIFCFVASPLLSILRVMWMWEPAQIGLGFITGLAMCSWGVCFISAVARLTTEKNRTSAFSLIFSVSVGSAALGGVVCGYLPQWLAMTGIAMQPWEVKRLILISSCALAMVGLVPVLQLRVPSTEETQSEMQAATTDWFGIKNLNPFLLRFLPIMALWTIVQTSFTPFANVYLSSSLHFSTTRVALIFSSAQIMQLCLGLLTPIVFRVLGLVNGIVAMQIGTVVAMALLAGAQNQGLAVALYLCFSAAQWMCAPGLYNLLMSETLDPERSSVAAMTMFCNALAGSAATAGAGILFTRFGYPPILLAIAALGLVVALVFRFLIAPQRQDVSVRP